MFCRECGFEILGQSNFCPRCGAPIAGASYQTYNAPPQRPASSKNRCSIKGIVGFGLGLGGISFLLMSFFMMSFISLGLAIPGLILSIQGAKETDELQLKGKGFATAGLIVSAITLGLSALGLLACVAIFGEAMYLI